MTGGFYGVKNARETFRFFYFEWDVAKAWGLVGRREPDGFTDVAGAATAIGEPVPDELPISGTINIGAIRVDWKKVRDNPDDYDTSVPLLYVTLPTLPTGESLGGTIIDGAHRLARAKLDGLETLPVYVLTPEEEEACRLGPDAQTFREMFTTETCAMCQQLRSPRDFKHDTIKVCDECELWADEHGLASEANLRVLVMDVGIARTCRDKGGESLTDQLRNTIGHIVDRDPRWTTKRLLITAAALHYLDEEERDA